MKRFTETKKWSDTWFQDLPVKYKLFWLYILDECDVAGVWKPNIKLAQFQIGEPFEEAELKRVFKDRVTVIENDYWHVKKFIEFQYGKLSKNSNPHQAVIKSLERHKIINPVSIESEGYLGTLKDKEQDKDKDQVQDQVQDDGQFSESETITDWQTWGSLIVEGRDPVWEQMRGQKVTASQMEKFISVAIRNNWKMDDQQRFRYTLKGFDWNSNTQPTKNRGKLQ